MRNFKVTLLDVFEEVIVKLEMAVNDVYELVEELRSNKLTAKYCYSNRELIDWHYSGDVEEEDLDLDDIIVCWENDGKMYVDLNEVVTFEIEEF